MADFDNLWSALAETGPPSSGDLASAIDRLPGPGSLPSPWVAWTLIGLVRHRRRQIWVGDVVATRLGGDPEVIARMGAFGHPPEVPQQGLVPGLTEWEYYFHGSGCCLTHRGTGEAIDVDFFGPTGEYFDTFFFLNYLRSLREPEPPEGRLIALHASLAPIRLAIAELLDAGLLTPLEGREHHPFRVADEALDLESVIDAFCDAWRYADRRLWLAATVGDWLAAHDEAAAIGDADLIEVTAGRAASCRALRVRELSAAGHAPDRASEVLLALDDIDAEALPERLHETLRGPIGGTTSTAVEIIRRRDDPAWCPALHGLFRRLDPEGELPRSHLWAECLKFLLRHGHRADAMRKALASAGGIAVGEAALLALEYDSDRTLPLFRRALRSPIPMNRTVAAATLALIDRPWSRRELLAVLGELDDQEATAECRAALCECRDEQAHLAVWGWEARHPHEPEPGPYITMGEVMLRNRSQWIRWEMEQLHERVMKIRDQQPGEAAGRLGRFRKTITRLLGWRRRARG